MFVVRLIKSSTTCGRPVQDDHTNINVFVHIDIQHNVVYKHNDCKVPVTSQGKAGIKINMVVMYCLLKQLVNREWIVLVFVTKGS